LPHLASLWLACIRCETPLCLALRPMSTAARAEQSLAVTLRRPGTSRAKRTERRPDAARPSRTRSPPCRRQSPMTHSGPYVCVEFACCPCAFVGFLYASVSQLSAWGPSGTCFVPKLQDMWTV
uniref:Uncharacterized protein n=1 Tax=Paramormyrops kingsleyae TaxID=1676925 RepID=A0A3B3RS50_9TELE